VQQHSHRLSLRHDDGAADTVRHIRQWADPSAVGDAIAKTMDTVATQLQHKEPQGTARAVVGGGDTSAAAAAAVVAANAGGADGTATAAAAAAGVAADGGGGGGGEACASVIV